MKKTLTIALSLLALLPAACESTSPSTRLERMYAELHGEVTGRKIAPDEEEAWWKRQGERLKSVRELCAGGELKTGRDYLYAAVILVETDQESDLANAHELGLKSAELGEAKGFRVAAEALDKLCVKRGLAQKYGTQYAYYDVIKAWRLYPVDPNTSDAERAAMGVEPMDRLLAREAELNKLTGGKPN